MNISRYLLSYFSMVTGTFVSSIYAEKDEVTERQVKFRKTKSRFVVVVLACLVVFGCEYCFDTPSVQVN